MEMVSDVFMDTSQSRCDSLPKRLCIHIDPERSSVLDVSATTTRLLQIGAQHGARCRIEEGNDQGPYFNVHILTNELVALWTDLQLELQTINGFAQSSVIVCEGEHGWDDYLLLHSPDPTEPLDTLLN
jgi:hypothetical protein